MEIKKSKKITASLAKPEPEEYHLMLSHFDDESIWTVHCYDSRLNRHLEKNNAGEIQSNYDGRMFKLTVQQLFSLLSKATGIKIQQQKKRSLTVAEKQRRQENLEKARQAKKNVGGLCDL